MDYYKVLGLHKNATKSEIKDAFRKLAVKFHPDKHTASTKGVKDSATLRFKQVSEAYDVLSDDRKRADYNLRQSGSGFASRTSSSSNYNGHGYQSRNTNSDYNKYYYSDYRRPSGGFGLKFEIFARYLTTRDFLLHAAFVRQPESPENWSELITGEDDSSCLKKRPELMAGEDDREICRIIVR